jgi:hypothetical protein
MHGNSMLDVLIPPMIENKWGVVETWVPITKDKLVNDIMKNHDYVMTYNFLTVMKVKFIKCSDCPLQQIFI